MKFGNIEIRFVFGIFPAIFILKPGKQKGSDAYTNYCVVHFRNDMDTPEYRVEALKLHELEHVKQFWMTLGLNHYFYFRSRRVMLWAEGKAHRVQALHIQKYEGGRIFVLLVKHLMNEYEMDITEEEAWEAIGEPANIEEFLEEE